MLEFPCQAHVARHERGYVAVSYKTEDARAISAVQAHFGRSAA